MTEEGKLLLLKIHNEVRNKVKTYFYTKYFAQNSVFVQVALGEEHGQPPAADMRKLVS